MPRPLTTAAAIAALLLAGACGGDPEPSTEVGGDTTTTTVEAAATTAAPTTTSPAATSAPTTTAPETTVPDDSPSTTHPATTTTLAVEIQSEVMAAYQPVADPGDRLLVHQPTGVWVVDLSVEPVDVTSVLGAIDGFRIVEAGMATDGTLVVELLEDVEPGEDPAAHKVVQLGTDGSVTDLIDDAVLFDVAEFGGVDSALVGVVWDGNDEDGTDLVAVPLDGRPPIAFGTAFAPEYGVGSIDVHEGVAVVSAWADLTEIVSFTDIEGTDIDLPSPTDDLPYGEEPLVMLAVWSPDGSELAWIEGPELYHDEALGEPAWQGGWRVRTRSTSTGQDRIEWPLEFPTADPADQLVTSLVHTGDRLVIGRAVSEDGTAEYLGSLVLDLGTEEPEMYEIVVAGPIRDIG